MHSLVFYRCFGQNAKAAGFEVIDCFTLIFESRYNVLQGTWQKGMLYWGFFSKEKPEERIGTFENVHYIEVYIEGTLRSYDYIEVRLYTSFSSLSVERLHWLTLHFFHGKVQSSANWSGALFYFLSGASGESVSIGRPPFYFFWWRFAPSAILFALAYTFYRLFSFSSVCFS